MPGSEPAIQERWCPSTARDDLPAIEEGKINGARLYRCLDRIPPDHRAHGRAAISPSAARRQPSRPPPFQPQM
jgi:hypothetical protein